MESWLKNGLDERAQRPASQSSWRSNSQIMKTALDCTLEERRGLDSHMAPKKITLTKLVEGDNIEDYLTTMAIHHLD